MNYLLLLMNKNLSRFAIFLVFISTQLLCTRLPVSPVFVAKNNNTNVFLSFCKQYIYLYTVTQFS